MNDGFAWGIFFNHEKTMRFKSNSFPSWWILMDEEIEELASNDDLC